MSAEEPLRKFRRSPPQRAIFAAKAAATSFVLAIIACLQLTACALRPEWQQLAAEGRLESRWLDAGRFRHLVLANREKGVQLRIYVEGDGTPWIRETRVSIDPTPTNPVLLRLMLADTAPAVYLGRPCYFGSAADDECEQRFWTFDRYGAEVVMSMCDTANRLSRERGASSIELVGYSGGGAIVMGMSTCTENLAAITTIAGNLEPHAWTEFHDYSPLHDLSPLDNASTQDVTFTETHWQCRHDENVPPAITDAYFVKRKNAMRHIVDDCTHATGWERYWPPKSASN